MAAGTSALRAATLGDDASLSDSRPQGRPVDAAPGLSAFPDGQLRPIQVTTAPSCEPPPISADEAFGPTPAAEPLPYEQSPLPFDREESQARSGASPDPAQAARTLVQCIVEVVAGMRPAPQLIRHCTPEVYSTIARRSAAATRRAHVLGRRTGETRRPPVVRSVHAQVVSAGIVEACATVHQGHRLQAVAVRLVAYHGRWIVEVADLG